MRMMHANAVQVPNIRDAKGVTSFVARGDWYVLRAMEEEDEVV